MRLFASTRKIFLKKNYSKVQKLIGDVLYRYDIEELKKALSDIGIRRNDTILVHGSFKSNYGFEGTPIDIIACLLDVIGVEGNLLMVSLPYQSSSYAYLKEDPLFEVDRTMSRMGIISETFRRKKGVLRSLHPTHPVLAYGKDAQWIVKDHEYSPYPCGEKTPFGKFRSLDGKVLFFDVPFGNFTFIHYIEDLIRDKLPFDLYRKEPLRGRVRDSEGRESVVPVHVFSEGAVKLRNPGKLEDELRKRGMLKVGKIGKTRLLLVRAEDAIRCAQDMMDRNIYFYDLEIKGNDRVDNR